MVWTIILTVSSSCVGQQLYGLRYLWRDTPCPFKQAAIYSSTDSNLPSLPYLKTLLNCVLINQLKRNYKVHNICYVLIICAH